MEVNTYKQGLDQCIEFISNPENFMMKQHTHTTQQIEGLAREIEQSHQVQEEFNIHKNNELIHVTEEEEEWNSIYERLYQFILDKFQEVDSIKVIVLEEGSTHHDVEEPEEKVFYFEKSSTDTENLYDEYVYFNGAWEKIGSNKIELDNYFTKEEVVELIEGVTNRMEKGYGELDTNKLDESDFLLHTSDDFIHVTKEEKDRWNNPHGLTIDTELDENSSNPVQNAAIAKKIATLASQEQLDEKVSNDVFTLHTSNGDIHITEEERVKWNETLERAKAYSDQLFGDIESFKIIIIEDGKTHSDITPESGVLYFEKSSTDDENIYDEYVYINGTWEKIGSNKINLSDYYTKSETYSKEEIDEKFLTITITCDDVLSETSDNPVKNKVIATEIKELKETVTNHTTDMTTHVTQQEKDTWNAKLSKTFTGVDVANKVLSTDETGNVVLKNGSGTGTAGKSAYEIAIDNGFTGTETEWLESLKGSDGDNGANGKDGKSIKSITKDKNNNIITTFTDGTTENIGQLAIDIQADFLTSDGFGNLRYYNGHFQYYDESTSTWVDTSVTPSNVYIMNMIPQEMKKIFCVYDTILGKYKLKFEEPDDTVIDGQVACIVEKVIIRRKLGSVPISEADGDLVLEVKRKDFGTYKNEYFVDTALSPSDGDVYYYKAFPMSTTGFYNTNSANETDGIKCKDYNLYGFKLDQNESDPNSMITYLSDCDNKYYESAKMNYTADTFNYGDWEDAWFIKNLKPCMLKYDGTVDYELDKNDYTKKLDGTDSDVSNDSYGGNAMIGIPKVYWKIVDNGDNTANIYFSDKQVDSDFHCWSHIDNNGNEIDYCYMPIYNGSNVNSVLRSISDKAPMVGQTATTEITYAKANNTGSDIIWYTELFNDRMLINLLLLLIGKSTDTQTVFGTGNNNSYVSASNTGIKNTGTMNTKGLFWGNQDNVSGVKVFGMEHWYGNLWRRIGGWTNDKETQKIKMTYGQSDGSTTDGYNETGSGYISIGGATPSGTSGGYISKMLITDNGLIPTIASGSATTYYCDGLWFNNSQINYAIVGGGTGDRYLVGALCSTLDHAVSDALWYVVSAISCKPLAL